MASRTRSGRRFKPLDMDRPPALAEAALQALGERLSKEDWLLCRAVSKHWRRALFKLVSSAHIKLPLRSRTTPPELAALQATTAALSTAHPTVRAATLAFVDNGSFEFTMTKDGTFNVLGEGEVAQQLSAALAGTFKAQQLESLTLRLTSRWSLLPLLPFCGRLVSLDLGKCEHLTGDIAHLAPGLQQLRHLVLFHDDKQRTSDMRGAMYTASDIAALSSCKMLESLTLHVQTSEVMAAVATLQQLKALDLHQCSSYGGTSVTPEGIARLSSLKQLTKLNTESFFGRHSTDNYASTFATWGKVLSSLDQLRMLSYSVEGHLISDAVLEAVGKARALDRLTMIVAHKVDDGHYFGSLTRHGVQELAHIPALDLRVDAVIYSCTKLRVFEQASNLACLTHRGSAWNYTNCLCFYSNRACS